MLTESPTIRMITKDSFPSIIREYQERVYHVVRKIVIDHDDTDDLVQETFIKVWQKRDSYKGNSQLFTWIYRIAVNEALQHLRKKQRNTLVSIHQDELLENQLRSEMGPDADEIQVQLQKAIAQLPDKQRAVFTLKYYDELKYEQIAEILGGSVGGLKANYHHAVKKIELFLQGALNH
jgi:RNA polymerase sigma-70 factor (ECF subfamily)